VNRNMNIKALVIGILALFFVIMLVTFVVAEMADPVMLEPPDELKGE